MDMKIWIISLNDEGERVQMRAYTKKEDAVATMETIQHDLSQQMRHTDVVLEKVEDLLVVAFYSEEEGRIGEKAVMTEFEITTDQDEQ